MPKLLAANPFLEQPQQKRDRNPTHSQNVGKKKRSRLRENIAKLKPQAKMNTNKVAVTKVLTSFSSINICYLQGTKPKK